MRLAHAIIVLIFLAVFVSGQQSDVLAKVWEDNLVPAIEDQATTVGLWVEDFNKDGFGEIAAAVSGTSKTSKKRELNKVVIYTRNGTKIGVHEIDSNLKTATVYDLDNDEKLEIVLSAGEELGKIQRGDVMIVSNEGNLLRSFDSTTIFDVMAIGDIEGDRYYEIAGGSKYRFSLFRSFGEKMWAYPPKGQPLVNLTTSAITLADIDNNNIKEIVAGVDAVYYADRNGKIIARIDVEPTLPLLKKGFKGIEVAKVTGGEFIDTIVVTKSNKVLAITPRDIDKSGDSIIIRTYNITWEDDLECDIKDYIITNIDSDSLNEILIACSDNRIMAIDNYGQIKWEYLLDGNPEDMFLEDMTEDKVDDILTVTSTGSIYLLSLTGNYQWKYTTGTPLKKVAAGEMSLNGTKGVAVVTNAGKIMVYKINEEYNQRRNADKLYNLAQQKYLISDNKNAKKYYEDAKKAYYLLKDERMVVESQTMIDKIDKILQKNERDDADIFLSKAQELYYQKDYENAKSFIERGKRIYEKYGDQEGVVKCELLYLEIENQLNLLKTTPTEPLNTTQIVIVEEKIDQKMLVYGLAFLILAVIVFVVYTKKSNKKKPKTIESLTETWGSDVKGDGKSDNQG